MRSYKLDEFVAHQGTVNCLRIGRETAGVLVTGGEDKKVNLWRIGQPNVVKSLTGLTSAVECVTFDVQENKVAAGGTNGTIRVWDLETGKTSQGLQGHRSNCLTLEFDNNLPYLVTGGLDTNVKLWDLRRKDAIVTYKGHTKGVKRLAISPDSKWVCSGSENGEVKVWELHSGRIIKDSWGHDNSITGMEFHPQELYMATSSADKLVKIWDLEHWEHVQTIGPEAVAVKAIAYHREGKQLLLATADALKVYSCDPIVHHDTVPMDWRQLTDMHLSYKDDEPRLVGCCCNMSAVGVFLVSLSKVMPFCKSLPGREQVVGIGSGGSRAVPWVVQQQQEPYSRARRPEQQQPCSSQHADMADGSNSNSRHFAYYPHDAGSAHTPGYDNGPASEGPLRRQLNRQRTPTPAHHPGGTAEKTSVLKQGYGSPAVDASVLQHLQPGQLPPACDQQQGRHKTGEQYFPEFEIRAPAYPAPPRIEQPTYHAASSRTHSATAWVSSTHSSSSSRQMPGYDIDAVTAAARGLAVDPHGHGSQQQGEFSIRGPLIGASSDLSSTRPSPREQGSWQDSSSVASRMPSAPDMSPADGAMRAQSGHGGSSGAAAADPILAAMTQWPSLRADLARMVSALQLVKGFVSRGNLEGAYKAVVNQGDASVACMLIEALQGRQDAFELNLIEPLLKLLELLLATGVEHQQSMGLTALSLVLRGPGQVVREVCNGPGPVGVDLSYERRKNKCLLVKIALEGLGMKLGVISRGSGPIAARAQIIAEELKQVVA